MIATPYFGEKKDGNLYFYLKEGSFAIETFLKTWKSLCLFGLFMGANRILGQFNVHILSWYWTLFRHFKVELI